MANPYGLEPIEENIDTALEEKFAQPERGAVSEQPEISETSREIPEHVSEGMTVEQFLAQAKAKMQSPSPTTDSEMVKNDVSEVEGVDEESRVSKLVMLAKEKGISHAFEVALKLDDLYVVDRLHDTLSGKLFEELVSEGVIKIGK